MLQFSFHHVKSTILPKDYQPRDQDVMCGRGNAWNHRGSRVFNSIIRGSLNKYLNATEGPFGNKSKFVEEMIRFFRGCGVLFVKFDKKTNSWFDIGDQQVFEKISHAFRDNVKKGLYKQRQQEQRQQEQREGTKDSAENKIKKTSFLTAKTSKNLLMLKQRKIATSKDDYTAYLSSFIVSKSLEKNDNTVNVASENIETVQWFTKQPFLLSSSSSPLKSIQEEPNNVLESFELLFEEEIAPDFHRSIYDSICLPLDSNDVFNLLNDDIIDLDFI